MERYREKEHVYGKKTNIRDHNDDIVEVLHDASEYMKNHVIDTVAKLAKYCYGTEKVINYGKYTEEWTYAEDDLKTNHYEYLYTLMQYEGEDILVHIGTGEFTPEVFTRRNVPQLKWFSYGSLPLFVITARAREEYEWAEKEAIHKHAIVRKFLNDHTIIYSPKWGQAELRDTAKKREDHIDLGKSNGIMNHEEITRMLQYAAIQKAIKDYEEQERLLHEKNFMQPLSVEKILQEMETLQWLSKADFVKRVRRDQKYHTPGQQVIATLLENIINEIDDTDQEVSADNIKQMYNLLKEFNIQKLSEKKAFYL